MGNMLLLGSILSLLTLSIYTPSAFLLVQDPTSLESTGPYEVDVELESSTHDRLSGESADQTKALLEVHDSFVFATVSFVDPMGTQESIQVELGKQGDIIIKIDEYIASNLQHLIHARNEEGHLHFHEDMHRLEIMNSILFEGHLSILKIYPTNIRINLGFESENRKRILINVNKSDCVNSFQKAMESVSREITAWDASAYEKLEAQHSILISTWDIVEASIADNNQMYAMYFYENARELVQNEDMLFVYDIPSAVPTGIGNVMLGFISLLSVHKNIKIKCQPTVLGNYSKILSSKFVYDNDLDLGKPQVAFASYNLLVMKDEESSFPEVSPHRNDYVVLPDNPRIKAYFSDKYLLNSQFDTSAIPKNVKKRVLSAIRDIVFTSEVRHLQEDVVDRLDHPSAGVTVRSYTAIHEKIDNIATETPHDELPSVYMPQILDLIRNNGIKSLFIAYDNPELLKPIFEPHLSTLGIPVLSLQEHSVEPLVKAAVEVLSLSETTYLIGSNASSFVHLAYWLGRCKHKEVLDPRSATNGC